MNTLIIKLNAAGDVVRTTTLLHRLPVGVTWITEATNLPLVDFPESNVRCVSWAERGRVIDRDYDLVINLEDDTPAAAFASEVQHGKLFGAYLGRDGQVCYSDDARQWFDLSLISVYGRERADQLKLMNRRTYQDLLFDGLGLDFQGESYFLPAASATSLVGDVAIAPVAGPVWPMKGWAYYDTLKTELEAIGLRVNVLPRRDSILAHLSDVANHRCLVSGDSLPMHLALGTRTSCVTLFNCTSPWEIHDYGVQTKVISPLLEKFFYKRGFDETATTAISLEQVFDAVVDRLRGNNPALAIGVTGSRLSHSSD